jgi:hypothetical protein
MFLLSGTLDFLPRSLSNGHLKILCKLMYLDREKPISPFALVRKMVEELACESTSSIVPDSPKIVGDTGLNINLQQLNRQ